MRTFLADRLDEMIHCYSHVVPQTPPLDFSLWDYVKDKMHASAVAGIKVLKTRITHVIQPIPKSLLANTCIDLKYTVWIWFELKGVHIEI